MEELGYQIGDFLTYTDKNGLVGIKDKKGNIIVDPDEYNQDTIDEIAEYLVNGKIEELDIDERNEFLEDYGITRLRVCDVCGKLYHEGYYLDGDYACDDECAIELYKGDEFVFRTDLEHADEDDGNVYWTAWED